MTLFDVLFAIATTVAIGVLMLFTPALSRGSTFFAVSVPEEFARSETARSIHRRYLGITAIATLAGPALILPVAWWLSREVAYGVGPLLPVLGGLAAFVHCRGIALRHARQPSTTLLASLERDRLADILPGRWWLHLGPYALLLAAMGWLILQWDQIPDPVFVPANLPDGTTVARAGFGLEAGTDLLQSRRPDGLGGKALWCGLHPQLRAPDGLAVGRRDIGGNSRLADLGVQHRLIRAARGFPAAP